MNNEFNTIQKIDLKEIDQVQFKRAFVGCLVLNHEGNFVLQQRGDNWTSFPGCLCEFGGTIEKNETPLTALIRELKEELGADVLLSEIISLGVIKETIGDHVEIGHMFFWQDKKATITGCYEGEMKIYRDIKEISQHPKLMESVKWLLNESVTRGIIHF